MTTQIKIEVDNKQKYQILTKIQNYYTDFVNNDMAREYEVEKLDEIIKEIFSEEKSGFNRYVVKYFSDEKEIDYDTLETAYNTYYKQITEKVEPTKWIGEGRKKR